MAEPDYTLLAMLGRPTPDGGGPLPPGGDGPTFDNMEARVARLEDDMKEIRSDLKGIRGDLQYVRGRLDGMPTGQAMTDLATSVAKVQTRVEGLPSMAKLLVILSAATAVFALMPKLQQWASALLP